MVTILNHPLWAWIAATSLAVLFAHAAVLKLNDRELLIHHLAGYGVPDGLRHGLAHLVIATECLTAMALISPWRHEGGLLAMVMLGLYALAMAWQLMQKRVLDCGCGAQALPVSAWLVGRNMLLMAWAGLASQANQVSQGGTWMWADVAVIVAAVLLLVVLYGAAHQVLWQHSLWRQRLMSRGV